MSRLRDEEVSYSQHVLQIPCFRKSFLYGISGGLGAGLLSFLLTSRVKKSTQIGFGSYVVITLATWLYCRTNLTKDKLQTEAFNAAVKEKLFKKERTEDKKLNNTNLHDA